MRRLIADASGAVAVGFAQAGPVDGEAAEQYARWLADGRNAAMDYAARHADVRRDPRLLLDGALTVISCAFSYYHRVERDPRRPQVALYALGDDYHEVVRRRLDAAVVAVKARWGGEHRVCVDTAPIRERWWARRAGIGFVGRNNQLIVPGAGSCVFLGEIVTTLAVEPDEPCTLTCGGCNRCVAACPGGALCPGGAALDARRCLSYLTIEHRGPLPGGAAVGNRLFGCDECWRVCPHNAGVPESAIPEFSPRPELLALERDELTRLDRERYVALTRRSALKRAKIDGLRRNASNLTCYDT